MEKQQDFIDFSHNHLGWDSSALYLDNFMSMWVNIIISLFERDFHSPVSFWALTEVIATFLRFPGIFSVFLQILMMLWSGCFWFFLWFSILRVFFPLSLRGPFHVHQTTTGITVNLFSFLAKSSLFVFSLFFCFYSAVMANPTK